ncbi:hypothetical protein SAMN05421505_13222 [Sinosporangium album]|uniref:Uncharacterized protein n=1 Tax=Sinosporangium album TaxID=504805 RepID=A0A1G8HGR5_9ACTN|nr:hypothetical protein [Sinosporangium album]SDI05762.1 hypothetical protein SAMN05421505_13222 [Sinosporangium album]
MSIRLRSAQLEELRRQWPEWFIWNSDAGNWYATRRGAVSGSLPFDGYANTVDADTAAILIGKLQRQEELAERHKNADFPDEEFHLQGLGTFVTESPR